MRITAQDLLELKVIDGIVREPPGGAHRAPLQTINAVVYDRRLVRIRRTRAGATAAATARQYLAIVAA